ncbi:MAG: hypothetical protein HY063_12850 [Bacteroidetes bacterium]|nr:hypothetical protein [Bacteroidota bacterium]
MTAQDNSWQFRTAVGHLRVLSSQNTKQQNQRVTVASSLDNCSNLDSSKIKYKSKIHGQNFVA